MTKIGLSPLAEADRLQLLRQELEKRKAENAALKEELEAFRCRYPRVSHVRPEKKVRRAGFDQPTQASLNRMKANSRGSDAQPGTQAEMEGWKVHADEPDEDEHTGNVDEPVSQHDCDGADDCACKACTDIVAAATEETPGPASLDQRSRLHDDDFYSSSSNAAKSIHLPFHEQYRHLRAAHSLAQATLWHALRSHWPEAQHRYYLEGPSTIRFGRSELENCFGSAQYPSQRNAMCGLPPGCVYSSMLGVVDLRNAICHPDGNLTLRDLDRLMQRAQKLSVTLLDESRSMQIRALRDMLQRRAREEFDAIETVALLEQSPEAIQRRHWTLHHQIFLHGIGHWAKAHEAEAIEEFGAVVVRLAQSWIARCPEPGAIDPEYLALVQKKREKVQAMVDQTPTVMKNESGAEPETEWNW